MLRGDRRISAWPIHPEPHKTWKLYFQVLFLRVGGRLAHSEQHTDARAFKRDLYMNT